MADRDNFYDVIRALAVMMVVFMHYRGWMPGGSIGVSIFFCLSGFLICRILLSIDATPINIAKFIFRRFMRVWPMMAFQIFLVLGLMALLYPALVPNYQPALWGLITFTSGYTSWVGLSPAVLWTLRAEFWFYVMFAAAFFIVGKARLPWLVAATIGISWIAKFWYGHGGLMFAIVYGDQLMYGAATALLLEWKPGWLRYFRSRTLLWGPLFFIGLLGAIPFKNYDWVWYTQTSATACWTAILLIHNEVNPVRGDFQPLATIGKVSFSIYLLHAVVIDFVSPHIVNSTFDAVLLFSAIIGLSIISYRLIELPFISLSKLMAPFSRVPQWRTVDKTISERPHDLGAVATSPGRPSLLPAAAASAPASARVP